MKALHNDPPLVWDGSDAPALLSLERLDANLFRNRFNQVNLNGALYGGQVFGQALAAAAETIEGRVVHSCHGYFLRSGQAGRRIIFEVEHTRDGGSFSSRRVVALQNGVPILHLECSFHVPRPGFDHQVPMIEVPDADTLEDFLTIVRSGAPDVPPLLAKHFMDRFPIELRPVHREGIFGPSAVARRQCWIRVRSGAPVTDAMGQRILLAYLSDFWLAGASLMPHAAPYPTDQMFVTSLDHAIWFHRDAPVNQWLLYDADSPSANNGVGLSRGLIYDRAGRLIATTMQEALQAPRR